VCCYGPQEQRTWVEQPNSALTTYDAAATAHWQRLGLLHVHSKVQLDYYALLEVPKDASAEQMKRQYYKLARRCVIILFFRCIRVIAVIHPSPF
jgi:hypothetical protein